MIALLHLTVLYLISTCSYRCIASSDGNLSASQEEYIVTIRVKTLLRSSRHYDITLTNTQDLDNLTSSIRLVNDTVHMFISSPSIQPITLQLKKRELIIAKDLMVRYSNKVTPIQEFEGLSLESCHFTGHVLEHQDSDVTLDMCQGVSGEIVMEAGSATINLIVDGSRLMFVYRKDNVMNDEINYVKYDGDSSPTITENYLNRSKRDDSYSTDTGTHFIELFVVFDNSMYRKLESSISNCISRAVSVLSSTNSIYAKVNTLAVLTGVEVWDQVDHIAHESKSTVNSEKLLKNFNTYQRRYLHDGIAYDAIALFTALRSSSKDNAVIGGICSWMSAGVIVSDKRANTRSSSTILAHQLGHLLGLEHTSGRTESECKCRLRRNCIMLPNFDTSLQIINWSSCSTNALQRIYDRNKAPCLKNKPKLWPSGESSSCGNNIVELGEECDCGPASECQNQCCDPESCQLKLGAQCASGSCCNLSRCKFLSNNSVCRKKNNVYCDVEEKCNGRSQWCPKDSFLPNGYPCLNEGEAFCYNGTCNSQKSQCIYIFGSNATNSNEDCYSGINWSGDVHGNCGWELTYEESENFGKHSYKKCESVGDALCGLLQCSSSTNPSHILELKAKEAFLVYATTRVYGAVCHHVLFDVGSNEYDIGQVPNGAKCGNNHMCVNHKCVRINLPFQPPKPTPVNRGKIAKFNIDQSTQNPSIVIRKKYFTLVILSSSLTAVTILMVALGIIYYITRFNTVHLPEVPSLSDDKTH